MNTRIATNAFVSLWMGLTDQRDPNSIATTETTDETMLNQLKSILMPYVLLTIIDVDPTLEKKQNFI